MDLVAADELLTESETDISGILEEIEMAEGLMNKLEHQVHSVEEHILALLNSDIHE
jgi:hypothetical protein